MRTLISFMILLCFLVACRPARPDPGPPDISGFALLDSVRVLIVHDVKTGEAGPRVSVMNLGTEPHSLRVLEVDWPGRQPHDLESIAPVEGTNQFLLIESGDDSTEHQRIYLASVSDGQLTIERSTEWPVRANNVEGTAVFRSGNYLWFVFAERAHGQDSTMIRWGSLSLDPLQFGPLQQAGLAIPGWIGPESRPVAAMDIDDRGTLYVVSTMDPGDRGPFSSAIWSVGRFEPRDSARFTTVPPVMVARIDGFKVESLVARDSSEILIGTDDEAYGAVIRRIRIVSEVK